MADATTTRLLTGAVPFVILLAAILAIPICAALLRWYRKSVAAGMAKTSGRPFMGQGDSRPPGPPPLGRLEIIEAPDVRSPLAARAISRLNLLAASYTLAGLSFAAVLGAAYIAAVRPEILGIRSVAPFLAVYAWPVVLALGVIYPPSLRFRFLAVIGYAVFLWLFVHIPEFEDPNARTTMLKYSIVDNAPFTILALAFLHRRIRAVGPMVFALLLVCLAGSAAAVELASRSDSVLRGFVSALVMVGLGAKSALIAILLLGACVFFIAGWLGLRLIEKLYRLRAISDLSLVIDAVWLLYGVFISIMLVFSGPLWLLTFVPAFAMYKIVLVLGQLVMRPSTVSPPALVQLRVFALGDESARLFEVVARYWRHVGSIRLIAGPDLATTTVEPHEFLQFLSFRFNDQFVEDPEHLPSGPNETDSDGRFRVHEYFCREDTWKSVLLTLVSRGDPILMDLRRFSPENAGCIHELRELMNAASFERVVLVTDRYTNLDYLRSVLTEAWRNSRQDSPNRLRPVCRVQLCPLPDLKRRAIRRLLNCICAAAEWRSATPATHAQ